MDRSAILPLFSLLILLSVFSSVHAQLDTTRKPFSGRVFAIGDTLELTGVHVINLTTLKGTISGNGGNFDLLVAPNDRILFSHLGYEIDTVFVTEKLLGMSGTFEQPMMQTSYLISIFKVLSIETFEEFEKAFLALQLPEEKLNLNLPPPGSYQRISDNPGFTIAIPFDLSYFSKKSRDLRKYKELMAEDERKQAIYARYNPGVVEMVTGIHDREEAEKLMNYCNFSEQFVREAVDYDLYVAIIRCYESYSEKE